MPYTDREILKQQESGAFSTTGAVDPIGEVNKLHRRTTNFVKTGVEIAATAVAETVAAVLPRKTKLVAAKLLIATTSITANASNFDTFTVSKRDSAGASKTTLCTFNTSTAAQGTLTFNVPAAMILTATTANLIIAAGSIITYEIAKAGTGLVVDPGAIFSLDLEEI